MKNRAWVSTTGLWHAVNRSRTVCGIRVADMLGPVRFSVAGWLPAKTIACADCLKAVEAGR